MKTTTLSKIVAIVLLLPSHVFAAVNGDPMAGLEVAAGDTKLLKTSTNQIVAAIINGVLSLLGSVFLALIVYGGFKWMTSRGNTQAVDEAKKVISSSVIGLVIVVTAYVITKAVIELLYKDTNAGGGTVIESPAV